MPFLDVGDYQLHYEVRTSHPDTDTLVFIHGLGLDSTTRQHLFPYIKASYNIVLYDFFGHGDTTPSAFSVSFAQFRNELDLLLNHLSIKKCHIVGNGLGGIIGLLYANKHPEIVQSLTLMSTPFYFPSELYQYEYDDRFLKMAGDAEDFSEQMVSNMVYPITKEKSDLIHKAFGKVLSEVYSDVLKMLTPSAEQNFLNELSNLDMPTLIMHGELDPVYPSQLAVLYSSYIKKNRLMIVPNASNIISMDQPAFVADYLERFISDHDPMTFSRSHAILLGKFNQILQNGYKTETAQAILQVHAIDQFEVTWNALPVRGKWNQRRSKELLLYLLLHQSATRSDLINTFFPEASENDAKNNLRVQLNHLRGIFKGHPDDQLHQALIIDREYVRLNIYVQCDLLDIINDADRVARKGTPLDSRAILFKKLMQSYHSTFLSSYQGEWVAELARKIEWKLSDAMGQMIDELEEQGRYRDAKKMLGYCQDIEPYDGFCAERSKALAKKMR